MSSSGNAGGPLFNPEWYAPVWNASYSPRLSEPSPNHSSHAGHWPVNELAE